MSCRSRARPKSRAPRCGEIGYVDELKVGRLFAGVAPNQAVTETVRPVTVSIWVPSAMVRMLVAVLR